jgi:hypothetical protein
MTRGRRLLISAGVIVVVASAVSGWFFYAARPVISLSAVQGNDMLTASKGALGEAIFSPAKPEAVRVVEGEGLSVLLAQSKESQGEGLIAAYKKDPERYKRYAQLLDTALNAQRLGEALRTGRGAYALPVASSALPFSPSEKLDSWGHPYCISRFKTGTAVVSGGPDATSFSCAQQRIREDEIASANRTIFQTASGEVVVVLPDNSTPNRN